jgi:Ulp1 family protease
VTNLKGGKVDTAIVANHKEYTITANSIKGLKPGQQLNDEIINGWISLINGKSSNTYTYGMNTYFYPKIRT